MRHWFLVTACSLIALAALAQPANTPPMSSGNPPAEAGHDRTSPIPPKPDRDEAIQHGTGEQICPAATPQNPHPNCPPPAAHRPSPAAGSLAPPSSY